MTSANIKSIYNLAPGFARDKDEDWMVYLPQADQIYMRRGRGDFIEMKDQLDELKSDLKEFQSGTARHKDIGRQIIALTKELDMAIRDFLNKIPALKEKAIKARDAAIEGDFAPSNRKRRAAEIDRDTYDGVTSTFDAFLPSHMFQPKPPEQPMLDRSQHTTPRPTSNEPAVQQQPARDTYLDGVADCDTAIMKRLRPIVEKYDCKDRVLEAVRRFRERDDTLETLKAINAMAAKT